MTKADMFPFFVETNTRNIRLRGATNLPAAFSSFPEKSAYLRKILPPTSDCLITAFTSLRPIACLQPLADHTAAVSYLITSYSRSLSRYRPISMRPIT